jgi:diguanylate cyclase (GGDEF)-like protein
MSHESGDELLRMFAERLRDCLRESDTIARLGGDEFGVLIENTNIEDLKKVANKILNKIKQPFKILGRELVVSNSIGISVFNGMTDQEIKVQSLLHNADIALYESKNSGRDTYRIYSNGQFVV